MPTNRLLRLRRREAKAIRPRQARTRRARREVRREVRRVERRVARVRVAVPTLAKSSTHLIS